RVSPTRCLGVRGFASRLRARRPARERLMRRTRHAQERAIMVRLSHSSLSRSEPSPCPMERSVTQPKLPPSGDVDDRQDVQQLYTNLRAWLPELEKLLRDCQSHWGYEDGIYRFYHHRL